MSGITATGASLGGTIIPIVARNLVELIGYVGGSSVQGTWLMDFFRFKWMMRVIALIELFMLGISNLVRVLFKLSRRWLSGVVLDSQTKTRSSSKY